MITCFAFAVVVHASVMKRIECFYATRTSSRLFLLVNRESEAIATETNRYSVYNVSLIG